MFALGINTAILYLHSLLLNGSPTMFFHKSFLFHPSFFRFWEGLHSSSSRCWTEVAKIIFEHSGASFISVICPTIIDIFKLHGSYWWDFRNNGLNLTPYGKVFDVCLIVAMLIRILYLEQIAGHGRTSIDFWNICKDAIAPSKSADARLNWFVFARD